MKLLVSSQELQPVQLCQHNQAQVLKVLINLMVVLRYVISHFAMTRKPLNYLAFSLAIKETNA